MKMMKPGIYVSYPCFCGKYSFSQSEFETDEVKSCPECGRMYSMLPDESQLQLVDSIIQDRINTIFSKTNNVINKEKSKIMGHLNDLQFGETPPEKKQSLGGRFNCICGKNSGMIYDNTKTTPCKFCGRVYLGRFNKEKGVMESIEYNPQQFQDITPVNTFANQQKQDKKEFVPDYDICSMYMQPMGDLTEELNKKKEYAAVQHEECIVHQFSCIKCGKLNTFKSTQPLKACILCGTLHIYDEKDDIAKLFVPVQVTPDSVTANLKFKDIKDNCVVRSIKKNTCNINRNRKCTPTNCVLMGFLNILEDTSDEDLLFNNFSKKCRVKTPNHSCSINNNRPCLAKNCVMYAFIKAINNDNK